MDKSLLVVIALFISAIIGVWWQKLVVRFNITHLLNYPARLVREGERRLNVNGLTAEQLKFRGILFSVLVIATSLFAGWLFSLIFKNLVFTLAALVIFLPVGSSWGRVSSIKKNLKIGNIPAARQQFSGTVFRHHAVMDSPSLSRAAIEYLSVQFSEKILSPIFWFMLLGVAGLFASVVMSVLYETIIAPSNKTDPFTKSIAAIHFIFNYIPARLAVFMWVVALLFLPSANIGQMLKQISLEMPAGDSNRLSLLCAASSLNLSLGGVTSGYSNDGWIGLGKTTPTNADITRMQFLFILLCLLLCVVLGPFI